MKYILTIICLLTFASSICQNQFPKDKQLLGLKGDVKKMTQTLKLIKRDGKIETNKVINFFNEDGRIISIENYPNRSAENENLSFTYLDDLSRILISKSEKRADTILSEQLKILENGTRLITSVRKQTLENGLKITTLKEQKFDALFTLEEVIEETSSASDGMKMKFKQTQTYFYQDKKLKKIKAITKQEVNDKTFGINDVKENENWLIYQNEKFDALGNMIYQEIVDQNGNTVSVEERTYEYY